MNGNRVFAAFIFMIYIFGVIKVFDSADLEGKNFIFYVMFALVNIQAIYLNLKILKLEDKLNEKV